MARHQLEHVVEKADARANVVAALALDADADANLRLARSPVDYGTAHKPSSASMTISVWRTRPAVMRMQPPQPGIARAVAHEDAALGEAPGRSQPGSPDALDVDQHEIARALPVAAGPAARTRRTAARAIPSTCVRYQSRCSRSRSAARQPAAANTLRLYGGTALADRRRAARDRR